MHRNFKMRLKLTPDLLLLDEPTNHLDLWARASLERVLTEFDGTVLFVSSIAGRVPMPFLMPYSMTKFALSAAGAGLRAELEGSLKRLGTDLNKKSETTAVKAGN